MLTFLPTRATRIYVYEILFPSYPFTTVGRCRSVLLEANKKTVHVRALCKAKYRWVLGNQKVKPVS